MWTVSGTVVRGVGFEPTELSFEKRTFTKKILVLLDLFVCRHSVSLGWVAHRGLL